MIKLCSLFSGSNGNATLIDDGATGILVDCGMSAKKIVDAIKSKGLEPSGIKALCITHEHADHIKGVGILSRLLDIPIYANENTWTAMEKDLGKIDAKHRCTFNTGEKFYIRDILVHPFSIPHDASEPVGFNFFIRNKKITLATDIGHLNKALYEEMLGSDFMLLEANHDIEMVRMGPYPWHLKQRILGTHGHLSNDMAGKLMARLVEQGTERFILGHLSHENNFPQLVYETVRHILETKGIKTGVDVSYQVAVRNVTGEVMLI